MRWVVAMVLAAGCASDQGGLDVEDIDATFGLVMTTRPETTPDASASPGFSPTDDGTDAATPPQDGATDAPAADAGPPPRSCVNVASFTEKVMPIVLDRCVRCHDGTKSKATKPLDLTTARDTGSAGQQRACDQMLKSAPDSSEQSPIFAEVNPDDPTTVHDFKYPSSMAYMTYRATVLAWLTTEQPPN